MHVCVCVCDCVCGVRVCVLCVCVHVWCVCVICVCVCMILDSGLSSCGAINFPNILLPLCTDTPKRITKRARYHFSRKYDLINKRIQTEKPKFHVMID